MTAHVLVSGTLFREPEQRTSKAGKPFTTATIRVKDGEATQWWKIVAFSEGAQAELLRLSDGDAVSVQGALRVETYQADGGETKLSFTCLADCVLPLRRERKPAGERNGAGRSLASRSNAQPASEPRKPAARQERAERAPEPELNDEVPF